MVVNAILFGVLQPSLRTCQRICQRACALETSAHDVTEFELFDSGGEST